MNENKNSGSAIEPLFLFGTSPPENYNDKMNQKAARVSTDEIFQQKTIPFEQIPYQSKLFLDFLQNAPHLETFYPEKNTPLEPFAGKVLDSYQTDRNALCNALTNINRSIDASEETFENIEKLRESDCLAIVTGQQAGLLSGAIYTIYKALSAVKLAADLTKQNIKTVPVFWIAEEDHDFDEIKKTFVLDKRGKLTDVKNTPHHRIENAPVGLIELDETINRTVEELFTDLAHTEFTGEVKTLLESYKSGETFSTAFAKFLAQVFHDYGLIILTPLDVELKRLCAPLFAEAVKKSDEIAAILLERNAELKAANYQSQVLVEKDSFPFFYQNESGVRQSLRKNLDTGKVKIQKSKTEFDIAELTEIAQTSPQSLSPNALLRPVVQDYLLPTLTYFGGAAEIAYFAQNSAIYKVLNRPVTPIRHRASLTIIEPKQARTLNKYDVNFTDLFDGKDALQTKIVERFLNQETAQVFDEAAENINAQLNLLSKSLDTKEPTLAANLINRRKKINWHIAALRGKYHRAEMLKNETVAVRLENLFAALLPNDALQERTLNVVTFLNLYGTNFIEWLYGTIETGEQEHQILFL